MYAYDRTIMKEIKLKTLIIIDIFSLEFKSVLHYRHRWSSAFTLGSP